MCSAKIIEYYVSNFKKQNTSFFSLQAISLKKERTLVRTLSTSLSYVKQVKSSSSLWGHILGEAHTPICGAG